MELQHETLAACHCEERSPFGKLRVSSPSKDDEAIHPNVSWIAAVGFASLAMTNRFITAQRRNDRSGEVRGLMNLGFRQRGRAAEEIEITAFVRLGHSFAVECQVAAGVFDFRMHPGGA